MRVLFSGWATGSLLVVFCSSIASAEPIKLIRDDRFALAQALVFNPAGFVAASQRDQRTNADGLSPSAHATFGDTTTNAESQMFTSISGDLHRFTGVANTASTTIGPRGLGQASGIFEVWFELDAPHAYDFDAEFVALGFASWQAHLMKSPGQPGQQSLLFSFISNTGPALRVDRQGSLGPGTYAFSIRSDANSSTIFGVGPSGDSSFEFEFDMAPVPEPASMLLVGSGVLGLLARRRRAHRSATTE